MTTIAYKDGVIAFDSRTTQGGFICDDDAQKHIVSNGVHYFMSGAVADYPKLLAAHSSGEKAEDAAVGALIWDGEVLYESAFEGGKEFWKAPRSLGKVCAIGSGSCYAITAMDMGATAKEAVRMAMKRDTGTGGRIRAFKIY